MRRHRLAVALRALLPLLLFSSCAKRGPGVFRGAPVVLISVDTLRADRLPAWGYRGVATPHLDRLRRDSILFRNAYAHVPLTLASHAALLTGLLPADNGVRDNYGYALAAGPETIPSFLKKQGYATGGAVSATVLERDSGLARGFDFYDDRFEGKQAERDGARTAQALVRWIEGVEDRPFFAFLHIFEPHTPYAPPEPYRSRYRQAYDGEIGRADEIVGSFLDALRQRKLYDRAVVIFLSDHGEGLGDHGEAEHGVFLYREAIHVPLLVKLPGSRQAGTDVEAPVGLTDIFPTVALLSGLDPPSGLAGIPLTRHFGQPGPPPRRIYAETLYPRLRLGWSDLASLIDARYHYIEAPRPELYDLVADPAEKHNLAAGRPPAFRAMRAELERMPRPFERPGASDPEHARKLASLGYVTATSPASDRSDLPDPKDRIGGLAETTRFERLLAEGRDAELIEGCRRFLANNPAALDTSRMLAHLLARRGETQAAIAALEKGLSASAATAAPALRRLALERLSVLLVRAGRDSEALEIGGFDSFTDPEALNAVGVALARAGRRADARKAFERALKLDPSDSRTHSNLGQLLLAQGDVAAARARLEEAVRLDARSAEDWSRLASARAQMGDERGAFEAWRRALEADPRRYDALFNLGIAAGRQGDLATARSCLERFLAEAPRAAYPREYAEARRILRTLAGRG